jgi:hypothetical protein
MSTPIFDKIEKAEKERQELLLRLLKKEKMVRGSFCQIYVKCGKKNCSCVTGKGHSHKRMSWHEKGKSFSRAVPHEDYEWIEQMTNNFREYRKIRKEVLRIETKIRGLLDRHEEGVLKKSRKGKPYLEVWK